ncbi:MAG TPA: tellurite resistance/C4-dicarboxylate transporter family protein [Kofleriaceae bacterium]|nr:tellurite resistance/C4-dicarboxylate transporter family protein [Kofleriaceae bacterium]
MTPPAPAPGGLAGMHPAYFALVMATGIVSLASELMELHPIAIALFALNLGFYPLLWILSILRVVRHRDRVRADLAHHGRAVGFFTTVAATCVLGTQCLVIGGSATAAMALWIAGIALWAILIYTVFTLLTVKPDKPALSEGINGGWLLSVVAAQSVAVLGAQLAPQLGEHAPQVVVFSLAMWLGGGMLYLWIISLIFYRYTFFTMSPSDLAPPYWINMGAAAISTLAGAMLVAAAPHSPVVAQILPFVRGLALMWWATATWWIPMLLILGVWRHVVRRFPLRYDPLYWGAVFPLGMYTVCTARLARAVDAVFLMAISRWFVYVALAAWTAVALGMLLHLVRRGDRGVTAMPAASRSGSTT